MGWLGFFWLSEPLKADRPRIALRPRADIIVQFLKRLASHADHQPDRAQIHLPYPRVAKSTTSS
jgi:hypothetical protein